MLDGSVTALAQAMGEYGGLSDVTFAIESGLRKGASIAIDHKWLVVASVVGIWVFLKLIFDTA